MYHQHQMALAHARQQARELARQARVQRRSRGAAEVRLSVRRAERARRSH